MEQQPFERANEPASFWLRVLAKLTDFLILAAVNFLLVSLMLLADLWRVPATWVFPAVLLFPLLFVVGYFSWCNSRDRQTVGYRLAGIRVIAGNQRALGLGRSMWRTSLMLFFISLVCACIINLNRITASEPGEMGEVMLFSLFALLLGLSDVLPVAFGRTKRALHDRLAGTQIVRVASPKYLMLWICALTYVLGSNLLFPLYRSQLLHTYYIPSGAMRPTLVENDRIVADHLYYRLRSPIRGDVVLFQAPPAALSNSHAKKIFTKRIIGVPGDVVEVHRKDDGKNVVFINGKPLDEPYIAEAPDYEMKIVGGRIYEIRPYSQFPVRTNSVPVEDSREVERILSAPPGRVPRGRLVVFGDNRNDSNDSHKWGFLPMKNLIGKAMCVFWPKLREL